MNTSTARSLAWGRSIEQPYVGRLTQERRFNSSWVQGEDVWAILSSPSLYL